MDADAFCINKIDELEIMEDFDIGMTLRSFSESAKNGLNIKTSYINAGVMFFRPSSKVINFIENWDNYILNSISNSDQYALNSILLEKSDLSTRNCVINVDGVRIKLFETEIYNWYYWPYPPTTNTKIIH